MTSKVIIVSKVKANINSLSLDELDDYGVELSSKNLPGDVQSDLFDAIDNRKADLIKVNDIYVVNSEIRTGETFESIGE